MFDASSIANILHLFDGFLHPHLRLMRRTQFRERVSDRSVALAASCSSVQIVRLQAKSTSSERKGSLDQVGATQARGGGIQ